MTPSESFSSSESFSNSESFSGDYQSLTAGCGFAELRDWSSVTMTGEDRHSFLHNMCTNDIRRLSAGDGCEAFCTDVKGKIVAHVFVIAREARLDLLTVPRQAEPLITHLDRYIIREDVQLKDRSDDACWIGMSGANAREVLSTLTGGIISECNEPWQNMATTVDESEFLISRCPLFWPDSYLLCCSKREIPALIDRLENANARRCAVSTDLCSDDAMTALRIESGLPLLGIDFSISNLPQEINRDELAISFNKGCYLGQETIARIDALGHVNQKIALVKLPENRVAGSCTELVSNNNSVGKTTSRCWSPHHQAFLALAMLRRHSNDVGCELACAEGLATVVAPVANSC